MIVHAPEFIKYGAVIPFTKMVSVVPYYRSNHHIIITAIDFTSPVEGPVNDLFSYLNIE